MQTAILNKLKKFWYFPLFVLIMSCSQRVGDESDYIQKQLIREPDSIQVASVPDSSKKDTISKIDIIKNTKSIELDENKITEEKSEHEYMSKIKSRTMRINILKDTISSIGSKLDSIDAYLKR